MTGIVSARSGPAREGWEMGAGAWGRSIAVIALLASLLARDARSQEPGKIAIIVNPGFPRAELSVGEIKDIYLGRTQSMEQVRIIPTDQKDSAMQAAFLKEFVGVTLSTYKNYWLKKVFGDGAVPPRTMANSNETIKFISETPGAIGYVRSTDLQPGEPRVKAVPVAGSK